MILKNFPPSFSISILAKGLSPILESPYSFILNAPIYPFFELTVPAIVAFAIDTFPSSSTVNLPPEITVFPIKLILSACITAFEIKFPASSSVINALISVCFTNPSAVTRVANSPTKSSSVTNPAVLILVTFPSASNVNFSVISEFISAVVTSPDLLTFVISPSSSNVTFAAKAVIFLSVTCMAAALAAAAS